MPFDPEKHHRRSMRLQQSDYGWPWWYFVTIDVKDHKSLLGRVIEAKVYLNEIGNIVRDEWLRTPLIRANVELDDFVIMPNHLHGIVIIKDGPIQGADLDGEKDLRTGVLRYARAGNLRSPSNNLGAIVRGFKSSTTKQINLLRKQPGHSLWQRNFYDHILRNDADLFRIRTYIANNPIRWSSNTEKPENSR